MFLRKPTGSAQFSNEAVPNAERSARCYRLPHGERLTGFGNIVNPEDLDALLSRKKGGSKRTGKPRLGLLAATQSGDR